jgi:hypothetical protein
MAFPVARGGAKIEFEWVSETARVYATVLSMSRPIWDLSSYSPFLEWFELAF